MSRRVQRAPRKRTGCATCKNAHVSCTEEKPACKRCQRLSLECQYEFKLLWEEDALQRNIAHGRCGVWTRDGKKTEPTLSTLQLADEQEELAWISLSPKAEWSFTNFAPKDFFNGLPAALQHNVLPEQDFESETQRVHWSASIFEEPNVTGSSREPRRCAITDNNGPETTDANTIALMNTQETDLPATKSIDIALPRLIPSCMPILSISKMDCQLLDYYIHELSPKCSLSAQLNPYLHTLLPVAYEFEPLRHTLLAASACQLYLASGDRQYELCSLDHRSKAIRGLNKHIYKNHVDWRSLATMVMFCFRDITDGCEPSWITHLKMGLRMLKALLCSTPIDRDLRKFCEIYFVAHDVMGRTAWAEDVTSSEHYEWNVDENYHEIDSIMGCSRELISLIGRISCLASTVRQQSHPSDHSIGATAANLMKQLSTLHQTLGDGGGNIDIMVQIAEVKRLSAMLYLHDRVMAPRANNPPALAHNLRNAIVDGIQQLPVNSGASLWPLFILGKSNLDTHDQAQFVLERLRLLEQSRYLGSVYHARRRVERNIMKRMTAHGAVSPSKWEDEAVHHDNERWVSLA